MGTDGCQRILGTDGADGADFRMERISGWGADFRMERMSCQWILVGPLELEVYTVGLRLYLPILTRWRDKRNEDDPLSRNNKALESF